MPFRPRKQSLGCSVAEECFNKVPKTVSGKNLKLFQMPPLPLPAALLPPCAFVRKCKMQRLKSIVCCTPQRLDSYLFKQSTDRCWARCAWCAWCALCPESALELLVQIKNTKLIPLTMPHAGTSHRMSSMCGGGGRIVRRGIPEKTGSVRLNECELS